MEFNLCKPSLRKNRKNSPHFDKLRPEEKKILFKCKIRRKLNYKYFRWPLELDLVKPTWLTKFVIHVGDYEPRLLIVAENLSNIDGYEYASVSGRNHHPPRRYTYRNTEHAENHQWLSSQLEYSPENNNSSNI